MALSATLCGITGHHEEICGFVQGYQCRRQEHPANERSEVAP